MKYAMDSIGTRTVRGVGRGLRPTAVSGTSSIGGRRVFERPCTSPSCVGDGVIRTGTRTTRSTCTMVVSSPTYGDGFFLPLLAILLPTVSTVYGETKVRFAHLSHGLNIGSLNTNYLGTTMVEN